MTKQLALYEELLDDEGAIIEQNPVVIVNGANLDDLRFALAPTVEAEEVPFEYTPEDVEA